MVAEKLVHIVDDDDSVRRSAAFMLKLAGFSRKWRGGASTCQLSY